MTGELRPAAACSCPRPVVVQGDGDGEQRCVKCGRADRAPMPFDLALLDGPTLPQPGHPEEAAWPTARSVEEEIRRRGAPAPRPTGVLFLEQLEPGPAAIQKAVDAWIAGCNRRYPGYRFRMVTPPDGLRPSRGAA